MAAEQPETGLNGLSYTDPDVYRVEQEQIFSKKDTENSNLHIHIATHFDKKNMQTPTPLQTHFSLKSPGQSPGHVPSQLRE